MRLRPRDAAHGVGGPQSTPSRRVRGASRPEPAHSRAAEPQTRSAALARQDRSPAIATPLRPRTPTMATTPLAHYGRHATRQRPVPTPQHRNSSPRRPPHAPHLRDPQTRDVYTTAPAACPEPQGPPVRKGRLSGAPRSLRACPAIPCGANPAAMHDSFAAAGIKYTRQRCTPASGRRASRTAASAALCHVSGAAAMRLCEHVVSHHGLGARVHHHLLLRPIRLPHTPAPRLTTPAPGLSRLPFASAPAPHTARIALPSTPITTVRVLRPSPIQVPHRARALTKTLIMPWSGMRARALTKTKTRARAR